MVTCVSEHFVGYGFKDFFNQRNCWKATRYLVELQKQHRTHKNTWDRVVICEEFVF